MQDYEDYQIFRDRNLFNYRCQQPSILQTFITLIEVIAFMQCRQSWFNFNPCPRVKSVQSSDDFYYYKKEYDFIVVGGGSAGVVIAARLAENPYIRVLLIEAGPEQPQTAFVPAFHDRTKNTDYDWKLTTVPQKNACKATGGVCSWPRGKMLCGSVCLSGHMYTRGHRSIYNKWGNNNPGWSYNEVMKYFKMSEHNKEPRDYIEPEYHGFYGPLKIGRFPHFPRLGNTILNAVKELNYRVADVNGQNQEAFTIASFMVENGEFGNPRNQYLNPVLEQPNLTVLIESYVTKVIFNNERTRAIGVELLDKWNKIHEFKASKEVILAAGVVGSPQILMLSGVGPRKNLNKVGIKIIRDLPVGTNLHYHVGFTMSMYLSNEDYEVVDEKAMNDYKNKRTGPLSSIGITQVTGFVSSKSAEPGVPDIQYFIDTDRGMGCFDNNTRNELIFRPVYLLTKCRGTLKLRSANPRDPPLIDPNYLCNNEEIEALIEAQRIVYKLTQTKALKPRVREYNSRPYERCNRLQKDQKADRAYWKCVIREYTNAENHPAGTCKMGPTSDKFAVVDHKLRVHGIKNLRVADASIMPTPLNCNPIGPIIMIGEKASAMIKATWRC